MQHHIRYEICLPYRYRRMRRIAVCATLLCRLIMNTTKNSLQPCKLVCRCWLAMGAVMLSVSCAALPDMSSLPRANSGSSAGNKVAGSAGLLSPERSEAILRKLKQEGKTDLLSRHFEFMQDIQAPPLVTGNTARLLVDGPATYRAKFDAIAAARHHVNLETYIFEEEGVGETLGKLLVEKVAQGVRVNLMYDSVGSLSTPREFFQALQRQGINICEFNPVSPWRGKLFSLNHRDHRKILVVDGIVGFTGGINVSSVYSYGSSWRARRGGSGSSGSSGDATPWRDTHIEVRGPAVRDFQQLFFENWQYQQCAKLGDHQYFPAIAHQGDMLVRTLGSSPRDALNLIYVSMLSAIMHAEKSIHLTAAYFIPDTQTVDALKAAAGRGVDVRLILPSFSDYRITFYAGRSYYTELLEAGIRIFERNGALLHAKTAVIDGVWSTVGSTNIDMRSFLFNDEINVVVLGKDFGQEVEKLFQHDLKEARQIDPKIWARRGVGEKMKEEFARLWAPLL